MGLRSEAFYTISISTQKCFIFSVVKSVDGGGPGDEGLDPAENTQTAHVTEEGVYR